VGVWLAALALLWLSLIIFTAFPSAISCVRIEVGGTVVTSFSHPLRVRQLELAGTAGVAGYAFGGN
jgi:hypothetical protein